MWSPFKRERSYAPDAGLTFDPDHLESRLVWIWTSARSGSTWFLRMLSHPLKIVDGARDPDDFLGFRAPTNWQGEVEAIPVDTTFISNHLMPLQSGADYDEAWEPKTFGRVLGLEGRPNYFFSPKYEDAWRPELRRLMLVRFHRLVERTREQYPASDPLVLLKEVAGAHAADVVMSLFPRSRMIFLARDGRDVVDSQTAANQPGGWLPVKGYETAEERLEFVQRRSRTWVGDMKRIQSAFDTHPAERRWMVRYEDLLADAEGTLKPLIEWLGLRRSDAWLSRSVQVNSFETIAPEQKGPKKFFRSATPGMWRVNLSAAERAVVNDVMGEQLMALGYSLDDGGDADAPRTRTVRPEEEEARGEESDPTALVGKAVRAAGAGRNYADVHRMIRKRGGPTSRHRRQIALTFDDGPVFKTGEVLRVLRDHEAKGTFFLVGRKIPGHERLLRRMLEEGHEIGNHSFGHAAFPTKADMNANTALIRSVTGAPPTVFRPPYGAIDRPGTLAAREAGMEVILWSVDSGDVIPPWVGIGPDQLLENVLGKVRPGSIVLMHDGQPWSRAAEALPVLIEALKERDYELVTVSKLLANGSPAGGRSRFARGLAGTVRRLPGGRRISSIGRQ